MSARRWVLGTRGSPLARWQSTRVSELLRRAHPGLPVEIRVIATDGDLQTSGAFGTGDRGVFVRRIEECLLSGEIDFAVHSLKDLPTTQPAGLTLAGVPERHDPRDALLSPAGWSLEQLPRGACIGTGSPRRRSQLLHRRPDLRTALVRGNVDTRVRKLERGEFDALVLALAGVERLGLRRVGLSPLDPAVCLPAGGQGALAVEIRSDDAQAQELLAPLDDRRAHAEVRAERAFLRRLGGGCLAPVGVLGRHGAAGLHLAASVGDPDGRELLYDEETGAPGEAGALGEALAERLLAAGAGRLLQVARSTVDGDGAGG